jgi:hypothetical protein
VTTDSAAEDDAILPGAPRPVGIDVGVVGVSEPRGRGDRVARSCLAAMEDYTALIGERTAMRALALPLTYSDPPAVAAHVMGLPKRVAAVFVIGLRSADLMAVQAEVTVAAGPMRNQLTSDLTTEAPQL